MSELLLNEEGSRDINELSFPVGFGDFSFFLFSFSSYLKSELQLHSNFLPSSSSEVRLTTVIFHCCMQAGSKYMLGKLQQSTFKTWEEDCVCVHK